VSAQVKVHLGTPAPYGNSGPLLVTITDLGGKPVAKVELSSDELKRALFGGYDGTCLDETIGGKLVS
jgi:hypothetical protein